MQILLTCGIYHGKTTRSIFYEISSLSYCPLSLSLTQFILLDEIFKLPMTRIYYFLKFTKSFIKSQINAEMQLLSMGNTAVSLELFKKQLLFFKHQQETHILPKLDYEFYSNKYKILCDFPFFFFILLINVSIFSTLKISRKPYNC